MRAVAERPAVVLDRGIRACVCVSAQCTLLATPPSACASGGSGVDDEMEEDIALSGDAIEEERKHFQKIANAFLFYK